MRRLLEVVLENSPNLKKKLRNRIKLPTEIDPTKMDEDKGIFKPNEIGKGYGKLTAFHTMPFLTAHAFAPSLQTIGGDITKDSKYDNTRPLHRMGVQLNRKLSGKNLAVHGGGLLAGGTYGALSEELTVDDNPAVNYLRDRYLTNFGVKDPEKLRRIKNYALLGSIPGTAMMIRSGYKTSREQGYKPSGSALNALSFYGGGLVAPKDVGYYDRKYREKKD